MAGGGEKPQPEREAQAPEGREQEGRSSWEKECWPQAQREGGPHERAQKRDLPSLCLALSVARCCGVSGAHAGSLVESQWGLQFVR